MIEIKFCCAVVFYNPTKKDIERIRIYNEIFDKVYILDNSIVNKELVVNSLNMYNSVSYYNMDGNKGMSKALEKAYELAESEGYDFILTMDQDSNFTKKNIQIMLEYIKRINQKNVALYVPNYSKKYIDKSKKKYVCGKLAIPQEEIKDVSFGMTSGSFADVKIINKILPLTDYFIAYVDNDISTSLIQAGYKIRMVGSSCMYQQVGEPVEYTYINYKLGRLHHSEVRYYYMVRNNFFYRKKYKRNLNIYLSSIKGLLRIVFNLIVFEDKKKSKIAASIKGYIDYKKGIMGKRI